MKKLLFVIPEYSHGGTNKSLENLLSLIDKTKYQISVYCLYEDGGDYYKNEFSQYILKKSQLYYWMHDNVVTRKVMGLYNKLTKRDNFASLYKRETRLLEIKYGFDVVVAYQEGTATQFVSYFDKPRKIAWIHFDYAMLKSKANLYGTKKWYDCYQQIVCVSQAALSSMLSVHPEYKDRSTYVYNTLDVDTIKKEGDKSMEVTFEKNVFNILSIGRFVTIKQFQLIPKIVHDIRQYTSKPFRWYIIGSGEVESQILQEISKYNLKGVVILLGSQDNPYPFIKQSNLVACTSVAESFSYVIAEAKILHTPVISTDFPVSFEVIDEQTGWIANIKVMPQLMARIINDEDGEYSKKKASIMNYEYSNEEILQKIDSLFDGER